MKEKYIQYLEKKLGITNEDGWKDIEMKRLQGLRIPPNWR
jgi:biotin operon repressor